MNKVELVKAVAERTGNTQTAMTPVVDAVFEAMTDEFCKGEGVQISGFGKFELKAREARTARNPKTGESVEVEAKTGLKFRPSSVLKDQLNVD